MDIILITVLYIFLFINIYWLHIIFIVEDNVKKIGRYPTVSIVIPAYNEEKDIKEAIGSLLNLDYPRDKYEIIVVDDGSTDNTKDIVKNFKHVKLISQQNSGKAHALNNAIKSAKGELFVCLDADSRVERDALKKIINHFSHKDVAAVIPSLKIEKPRKFIEKLQWYEYLMCSFLRNSMSKLNALIMTHGVFSVYRREVLLQIGGFDENNLTEDFEIAMRLRKHKYNVKMENTSVGHTNAPKNFRDLIKQRERWARGYIHNGIKYREMLFNKRYGTLGTFHLPLTLLSALLFMIVTFLVLFKFIHGTFDSLLDIFIIKTDLLKLIKLPDTRFFLNIDTMLLYPIFIGLILAIYFFYRANKAANEKLHYPYVFISYLFYYGFLHSFVWIKSLLKEATRAKRKW
ncbi:glycosyltransferase [Candidatus Woesearchaeota archaeon]|nr:glycosyltransferase [Candidatus Woesearchaeota archaeon]